LAPFFAAIDNFGTPIDRNHRDGHGGHRDHNHGNGDCGGDGESAAAITAQ
jgi:hypothetical protein